MSLPIGVRRLEHGADLPLPSYATLASAGMDLTAAIPENKIFTLEIGKRMLIPTGLCIELPDGYEGQVRPRSGLALKHGITDYRGEVSVLLINHGDQAFDITRGMRIAQLIVAPVIHTVWDERDALGGTSRGAGGYGSTGV